MSGARAPRCARQIVRARRSSTTVASRWIFRTRPLSTVPGPTSTYVVTPSTQGGARRPPSAPATRPARPAPRSPRPRRASARRRRWRRPARAGRATASARSSGASRSSAGFISAQWNGALTGSGIDALGAERLRALAGARHRVARRRRSTTCPAPFRLAGLTTSPCAASSHACATASPRRARASPPSRRCRPAPPPACSGRGAARSAAHRRTRACRRPRWRSTRRGCARRRTPARRPCDGTSTAGGDADGEDRRLRVLGERQLILGPFEAEPAQRLAERGVGLRERLAADRETPRRAPCPCRPSAIPVRER